MKNKITTTSFKEKVKKINPNIEVKGEYINAKTRMECKCKVCGYEWSPVASSLSSGCGCPKCAGNMKKTHAQFVGQLKKIQPNLIVLGTYQNAHTKILCKCKKCGNEWEIKPNNLLNGQGCNKCAQEKRTQFHRKEYEQFVKEVADLTPSIEVIGTYINAHTPIKCRCKICDNEWNPLPMDLVKGTGCPECCHTSTSFFEQSILLSFIHALGSEAVLSRDKSLIGMELDIYIPSQRLAIEPGSWLWHANKIDRDLKKRELCREKGVRLITIYDKYPNCEKPFENDCLVFQQDFSVENNKHFIKNVINQLFVECGILCEINENDWKRIKKEAYLNSRKKTTDSFIEQILKINPKVEVIGEYKTSNTPIKCRCQICKYEWSTTPGHLLRGQGCPKCAGHMKKTQEQFIDDLKKKNSSLTVLGTYVNSVTPILVKCNVCDNEWESRPANLLTGYGCPKCAIKKRSKNNRLTHTQFLERMKKKGNPNTRVLGKYINAKTKILCKCNKCGYEWMATPNSLMQGHGCKKCADILTGKAVRQRHKKQ